MMKKRTQLSGVPTPQAVIEQFGPWMDVFTRTGSEAFERVQANLNHDLELRAAQDSTAIANMVHCMWVQLLEGELAGDKAIRMIRHRQSLFVEVERGIQIRFKKLNACTKMPSNVQTCVQTLMYEQKPLPGAEEPVFMITCGYVLNDTETEIDGWYLVCTCDARDAYWRQRLDPVDATGTLFDGMAEPAPIGPISDITRAKEIRRIASPIKAAEDAEESS